MAPDAVVAGTELSLTQVGSNFHAKDSEVTVVIEQQGKGLSRVSIVVQWGLENAKAWSKALMIVRNVVSAWKNPSGFYSDNLKYVLSGEIRCVIARAEGFVINLSTLPKFGFPLINIVKDRPEPTR
jgi:hypothetical protein